MRITILGIKENIAQKIILFFCIQKIFYKTTKKLINK